MCTYRFANYLLQPPSQLELPLGPHPPKLEMLLQQWTLSLVEVAPFWDLGVLMPSLLRIFLLTRRQVRVNQLGVN